MSVFGDYELADAYDREPPAPEQVAYKLHELRTLVDALAGDTDLPTWDQLTASEQDLGLSVGEVIVAHIVATDPDVPEHVARELHNVRRYWASSRLPPWEDLDADERQVGIDLMATIIGWLRRQGALG